MKKLIHESENYKIVTTEEERRMYDDAVTACLVGPFAETVKKYFKGIFFDIQTVDFGFHKSIFICVGNTTVIDGVEHTRMVYSDIHEIPSYFPLSSLELELSGILNGIDLVVTAYRDTL